jgi:hypothetical protein
MANRNGDPRRGQARPDPVAEFAAGLRELRAAAGSPSFRHLAKITHYSSSALAEATSGKRLPSQAIVRAFATGCGADPDEWADQLHRAAMSAEQARQPLVPPPKAGDTPAPRRRRAGRRYAVAAAGACSLLAAGVVMGAAYESGRAPAPVKTDASSTVRPGSSAAAHASRVSDGADPVAAGCTADAHLVDKSPVTLNGTQIGALEFIYSDKCGAGWARAYLYPGQSPMLAQVTIRASDGRLSAFANPLIKQVPIYTNVIVPHAGGCLAAQAVFHHTIHALVTASIPCQMP